MPPSPDLDLLDALDVRYTELNAQRSLRAEDGALVVHRAGPLSILVDRARPHDDYYNRIVGLSVESLVHLDHALARLSGIDVRIDVAADRVSGELSSALIDRAFAPKSALVWLAARPRDLDPLPTPNVRRLRDGEQDALFDLMSRAEELESAIAPEVRARRRKHHCTESFRCYIAEIDGAPAAWATMFVEPRGAILGNAFTLAANRGRGCHAALFAARIRDAAELEVPWIFTDVEPRTISLRNAERAGLRRVTSVLVWTRGG